MKMRTLSSLGLMALLAALLLPGLPCGAQEEALERIGDAGSIDWVSRKLTAIGIGVPTQKAVGQAQMRAMVRRAAVVVARRNLLEVVKGVQIDSSTRVQNFMVKDDTIESRVKGVLSGSSVDQVEINSDGTATATVSMPLTGQLEQMLMKLVVQIPQSPVGGVLPLKDIDNRLRFLENRVRILEEQIGTLKRASVSQEQMLMMFRSFTQAWLDYVAAGPVIIPAGVTTGSASEELNRKYAAQEAQLAKITTRLNDMAARLQALEGGASKPAKKASKTKVAYTGLVIDARKTGFRPCLKPELIGQQQVLYPGNYIRKEKAVRSGYVRYYRNLARAQSSPRAGNLPLTIKATGTPEGKSRLSISAADYKTLADAAAIADGFLANCKVIIVF